MGKAVHRAGENRTNTSDVETRIAALDTEYQAAVKNNDAAIMDRILADDFILVTGRGKVYNKTQLLEAAKNKNTLYEHQEDTQQTVRVWVILPLSRPYSGRKGCLKGNRLMITSGSATRISARQAAGVTYLGRSPFGFRTKRLRIFPLLRVLHASDHRKSKVCLLTRVLF